MAQEHRSHPRMNLDRRVYIELVSPQLGADEPGEIALCRTVDVSTEGLQVQLDCELKVDSILQIGVEFPAQRAPLYLAAEVVWCRPSGASGRGYSAGLKVLNADGSDVGDWRRHFTHN